MNSKVNYRNFIIALILVCILFAGSELGSGVYATPLQYDIICFGDSVLGQIRDETSIPNIMAKKTGKTVFNASFGGTTLSRHNTEHSNDDQEDGYAMIALARAIENEDFGLQQALRLRKFAVDHFPEMIDDLDQIDFQQAKTIIIRHGVNDYHSGIPLENPENPYDEYTFCGALRGSLKRLKSQLKDARIILVTPTFSWYKTDGNLKTCEEWNTGYGVLKDYVRALHLVAAEFDVEVLDQYDLFPHESLEDYAQYTVDGLHPNLAGRERIAQSIADFVNQRKSIKQ
ncbi:MAG: GDSL-type esterase/lipase family protein [Clostridium sp.]|jgi:lysophospholipase L1-like esterase|nr:GDSL-type esterase/lipase family protein [Clostridium sp.]